MKPEATNDSLPRQIGGHDVVGRLARGGMAEILLARRAGPAGFERPVVLKRILPHLAGVSSFVEMFLDEAKIASGIRHPNVAQVHQLGQQDDHYFLVMDYLEGETLGSVLRRLASLDEPLGDAQAVHIVAQVCGGLHAAHDLRTPDGHPQNVVHRDLSPANIFVTYEGHVLILDFGIARAAERITSTEAGQLKGTFAYMSPEQARGRWLIVEAICSPLEPSCLKRRRNTACSFARPRRRCWRP